jgi:hypothetical protein
MKKLLLLAIIALSVSAFGQTKTPMKTASASKEMTVKEYFLAIPTEYLKADAKKRATWIESDDNSSGYLSFNMPADEIPGGKELEEEGVVYGNVQVFKKTKGGVIIGFSVNMCAESKCVGQMLMLDYTNGKWEDLTSDLSPMVDNDEVIKTLKTAPAYENKKELKDGVEIPLAIQFNGNRKTIDYLAGCVGGCDGGVVVKMFKWNGSVFTEFEEIESPE